MATTGIVQGAVFPDDTAASVALPEPTPSRTDLDAFFDDYHRNGKNPEIVAFELRGLARQFAGSAPGVSVWEYIADAVEGTGGFANGQYLFPHKLELSGDGHPTHKLLLRRAQADYNNFAGHIRNAPWDIISNSSDLIARDANGAATDVLNELWQSVDGSGTSMTDFLEFPHKQSRSYGTGVIVVDRRKDELRSEADNKNPENRPYVYAVPTQNVVHWTVDRQTKRLIALAIIDPQLVDDGTERKLEIELRIWTRDEYAVYRNTNSGAQSGTVPGTWNEGPWTLVDRGVNELGEVPAVPMFNEPPDPGLLLGKSEMLDVARTAQTVYNIDSEAREHQRKAATFLAIPVKDASATATNTVPIGLETGMGYDGPGEPKWVSPPMDILDRLETFKEHKIGAAYQMAGLGAIAAFAGVIQTSSGFHAEVEYAKTERRIAHYAAELERVEKAIARLALLFVGLDLDDNPELCTITYPREFGVRDLDSLTTRTADILSLNLGPTLDTAILTTLFKAMFPRKGQDEIDKMATEAVKTRDQAAKLRNAVQRTKAIVGAAGGANGPLAAEGKVFTPVKGLSRRQQDYADAAGGGEGQAIS